MYQVLHMDIALKKQRFHILHHTGYDDKYDFLPSQSNVLGIILLIFHPDFLCAWQKNASIHAEYALKKHRYLHLTYWHLKQRTIQLLLYDMDDHHQIPYALPTYPPSQIRFRQYPQPYDMDFL